MSKCAVLAFVFLHISAETDEFGIHLDVCGCVKKKKKELSFGAKIDHVLGFFCYLPYSFLLCF